MKKTKIKFEDIKAGDLLEVVAKQDGVKTVLTGIAFKFDPDFHRGYEAWKTSEGGLLVATFDEEDGDEIWRIDVMPATFDDIKAGDRVLVRKTELDTVVEVVGTAAFVSLGTSNDYWLTQEGRPLIFRLDEWDIEILERADE